MWGNGWYSPLPSLDCPIIESDCLSLPTPTALSSLNSRPPGQNKLEVKLKELGLIQRGEVANPELLEAMFGLPMGYTSPLEYPRETVSPDDVEKPSVIPSVSKLQDPPSNESSTSILCADNKPEPCKIRESKGKYATSKKSDCWYTPPHIVELIVRVLGGIDLDPCADDGRHIPAQLHYTAADNGLIREWHGRVFLNPPYSCPGVWMKKMQAEVAEGRVTEAIALVPAATDTNWLSPVLKTQPVCFWKGRIKFLDANYQPKLSARQSHVLVYWGENWQKFREVFEEYGFVSVPIPPSTKSDTHNQVLGENASLLISPSTQVQGNDQTLESKLLLAIPPDTQVSNDDEMLGENLSPSISPSTQVQGDSESLDVSLLSINFSDTEVSNDNEVLGENSLPSNSPSTQRKHGEGSGNLSWGYANANSGKKKPIKQLYFEWEYGGVRGKTYVRSHLKERVIELNEAKVPVTEILKLLTYNPKVKRVLYLD
jgi:phage N-6-adenine-methyltransferase